MNSVKSNTFHVTVAGQPIRNDMYYDMQQ